MEERRESEREQEDHKNPCQDIKTQRAGKNNHGNDRIEREKVMKSEIGRDGERERARERERGSQRRADPRCIKPQKKTQPWM